MAAASDRAPQSLPDKAPSVSAVVISYYTGPVLARCLAALKPQVDEIILVDNGNPSGEIDRALSEAPGGAPVRILSGHGNIGFAAGCNLGAASAVGDMLLFLNPDAVLPEDGVARLLSDGEKLDRPWMQGAKLVGPDGEEQQGSRRAVLTPWRAFVEASKLYRLAPQHPYFQRFNLHTEDCPQDVAPTPTISGACIFLPRADYAMVGGMDERYFMHVEDVDFCLRFAKAGGGIYFNPHVSIQHYKSSSRANPIRIEARKTAGAVRYFNTHFSETYPKPFLWLLFAMLWVSFGLLFVKRGAMKMFRIVRLFARSGWGAIKRARAMAARRLSR